MTTPTCGSRSGDLAMYALGRLDGDERDEVERHLASCDGCRATVAELASTVGALDSLTRRAEPVPVADVPPDLARAVLADLHAPADELAARRRRVRRIAVACVSVAAAVVVAALVAVGAHHTGPPSRTVALRGTPGVTASAVLVEQPWGTSLTVREQGLTPGSTFTVSMDDAHGRWWTAGSYRATGSTAVEATMACAARYGSIHEIRVTDPGGRAVLSSGPTTDY